MDIVSWEDPPTSSAVGRPNQLRTALAELAANPGKWACLKVAKYRYHMSRAQIIAAAPENTDARYYEVVTRALDGGLFGLYLRYNPPAVPVAA